MAHLFHDFFKLLHDSVFDSIFMQPSTVLYCCPVLQARRKNEELRKAAEDRKKEDQRRAREADDEKMRQQQEEQERERRRREQVRGSGWGTLWQDVIVRLGYSLGKTSLWDWGDLGPWFSWHIIWSFLCAFYEFKCLVVKYSAMSYSA